MKSVRFSKVVEKCGKPEVYLLMSETDPEFHHALEAGKIMSLSDESHGSGTEYGTVGYVKKHHGQLLLFPNSLKAFADAKIIGIKYDLLVEEKGPDKNESGPSRPKKQKEPKEKAPKQTAERKSATRKEKKKGKRGQERSVKKVISFPAKSEIKEDDQDNAIMTLVRQALRALEKGNSVAAYNILKRIVT